MLFLRSKRIDEFITDEYGADISSLRGRWPLSEFHYTLEILLAVTRLIQRCWNIYDETLAKIIAFLKFGSLMKAQSVNVSLGL